jgi:hypothetical protein
MTSAATTDNISGGRRMGKRVNYFDRQFLRAEDFQVEQGYHLQRRRGVSAGVFRAGVATGLEVVRVDAGSVRVTAGLAIDGLGREIVLEEDSGVIAVDPAAAVEIWIAYAEAPADPVSYLGADEQRFTRTDEAPAIVPVPPGSVPADGIRLAVVPPGGDPDMSARRLAGPRDGSVTALSLADDAVGSRALAEADGAASGQDTASGSGVKTNHIQDGAVTSDKLADDVVDGLAERTIEKLLETGVPIADKSIAPDMLADDAVSSRALAEAAPGSTDQDTSSGAGVKTGHLTDKAVTGPKLADGAVTFEKLVTKQVFDGVVTVPRATGDITQPPLTPGRLTLTFEQWPSDRPAFYLIYCRPITVQFAGISWKHYARHNFNQPLGPFNGVEIENFALQDTDVRCVAFRLGSLFD